MAEAVASGVELRCKAADAEGETRGVTLRLTDLDGAFEYAIDGEAPAAAGTAQSSS